MYKATDSTIADEINWLHEIQTQIAGEGPLHDGLRRIANFAASVVGCDSCFVYVLEGSELVLRASKSPNANIVTRAKVGIGEGITASLAERLQPVVVAHDASHDPRFRFFNELPEEHYEAFLSVPILCRGKAVGLINLQHRVRNDYTQRQIQVISTLGCLAGAAIEIAQLEKKNAQLSRELEDRKVLERAKGIVQREMGLSEEEAYITLQKRSRQLRRPLREVADAVILNAKVKTSGKESLGR